MVALRTVQAHILRALNEKLFCNVIVSTLEVLKTPYEFKEVDLFKGENK